MGTSTAINSYFIFCHGWGGNPTFLAPLIHKYFPVNSCCLDLGYFGQSNLSIPHQGNHTFIGIGHSLGLKKLISLNVSFKALIGIHGFIDFLGSDKELHQKRKMELDRMKRKFKADPVKTLLYFYEHCGICLNPYNFLDTLNATRLMDDFKTLTIPFSLPLGVPTLILAASDDSIVPETIIYNNFDKAENVTVVMHETGRHSLGLHHCGFVYNQIMKFLHGHI